ncbi:Thiamine pyrophosphate enzyme C-terminal TPP-binding [Penicillium angulare]|uniref:Thiamine pyrophosphate enzyme C-terminal TPP-binding n=1 Tax=Penicillium angulare TaxID=116970 RepID=UPI00253F9A5A|nr:Thiamine pyrophosphate enzyme C-terminal TPP-binding [Penicillium angulare]KAJ5289170.1 Thiamine pyrophosphate enzyme C-terminal TPP-binding [Penicillium angulare]
MDSIFSKPQSLNISVGDVSPSTASTSSRHGDTDTQLSSDDGWGSPCSANTVPLTTYLFTRLRQMGIRAVHGVPGDFSLTSLDYIRTAGLQWAGNSAELHAGYAADGYARIKGIGALMTVFGVGELSAINAVAGSYAEKVPVVHIVGTTPTKAQDNHLIMHHSLGDGNHRVYAEIYKNFTCAQVNLRDAKTSPMLIDMALRRCVEESRPVYIELPFDKVDEPVSASELSQPLMRNTKPMNDPKLENLLVNDILRRIYESRQPVIIVDGFAGRYGIVEVVNQFLEATGIFAVSPPFGQGIIKESYAHYCGVFTGPAGSKELMDWFEKCDLVIHVAPLKSDSNTCSYKSLTPTEITIELDEKAISVFGAKYFDLNLKSVLESLLRSVVPSRLPPKGCLGCLQHLVKRPSRLSVSDCESIDQARFWPFMSDFLRPSDILIADIGTSWSGTGSMTLPSDITVIKSGIWFSIGYALGACVGAAHAQKELIQEGKQDQGRVILFEGDGSLQVTAQAISDIIKNKLDVTIFVINNAGYTIERLIHGKHAEYNDVQSWNYTQAAKFFGAPENDPDYPVFSKQVFNWGELSETLTAPQLVAGRGFALVEVMMDAQDAPKVLSTFLNIVKGIPPSKEA